jgi:uncharacterized protein
MTNRPEAFLTLALLMSVAKPVNADTAPARSCGTDMHMHIHSGVADDMKFDGERALLALEGAGIDRGVALSHAYNAKNNPACYKDPAKPCIPDRVWTEATNDWTLAQAAASNGSLIPFCGVDPRATWAVEEIQRCKQIGMRGLKIHTMATGLSLQRQEELALVQRLFQAARDAKLPILIHGFFVDEKESAALLALVKRNPENTIIIGHLLGKHFPLLAGARAPNLYVEGSVLFIHAKKKPKEVVDALRAFGIDQVLFGSDWPVVHPSETLARLRNLPLTADEIDQIVCRNAKKLIP